MNRIFYVSAMAAVMAMGAAPQSMAQAGGKGLMAGCKDYPAMLAVCKPYSCKFEHPLMGGQMEKRIIGEKDGKCLTTEQMPGNGRMECAYTVKLRNAVAQSEHEFLSGKASADASAELKADGTSKVKSTYTVNGKQTANPAQDAFDSGQCRVIGYD